PFGFALFYLRSVAAKEDYKDRITGQKIPAVTTAQIYKGSIAFIVLQLIMVACVIAFPSLVAGGLDSNAPKIDADKAFEDLMNADTRTRQPQTAPSFGSTDPSPAPASAPAEVQKDDPMKGFTDAIKEDQKK
ncbi:MAG: C4-dicarboxylate ABC transporter, partial [Rubrivivax sp.]|nr:C4-dicarboxylate ABC transporter [Rubrivivax sp.]